MAPVFIINSETITATSNSVEYTLTKKDDIYGSEIEGPYWLQVLLGDLNIKEDGNDALIFYVLFLFYYR